MEAAPLSPEDSQIITVENTSTLAYAQNVIADVNHTSGALSAQPDASCSSIPPRGTCQITLIAHQVMAATNIVIQGSNTNMQQVSVVIEQASLSVNPSTLRLTTETGNAKAVLITNIGSVTAYMVNTILSTPNLNITSHHDCPQALEPGEFCSVNFISGGEAGNTNALIKAINSNEENIPIAVVSPVVPTLELTNPVLGARVIRVGESALDMTVQSSNLSATSNTTITASIPSAWNNQVSVSYSNCVNVSPGNSCVIHLISNAPFVAESILISGTNGANSLSTYVAFYYQGGLVFSREENTPSQGLSKIKVVVENDSDAPWGLYTGAH